MDCGPDWSWEVVEAAVARGPHPTASTPDSIPIFKEDIAYQCKASFCKVMLWEDLKPLRPPNLKTSPVAVVPQVGQQGQIILDHHSQCIRMSMEWSQLCRPVSMT